MALTMPKNAGGNFELCPAGNHVAICYRVLDLGTQEVHFEKEIKYQRKIYIGWEIPGETMEDGRPFVIGKRYTYSSHEKATLRQHLEAWRNKRFTEADFGPGGFHIKKVLGVPCMIQVVHTDRDGSQYANVATVGSLPKGLTVPSLVNPAEFFSLEPDEFDAAMLEKLSEKLQEVICSSPEYKRLMAGAAAVESSGAVDTQVDDDIPF
jgi:hypothetical protein